MKNEFFNKVKTLFSSELDNNSPITEKFLDIKTEDGRVFRVDGEELIVDIAIKEIVEPEEGDDTGESGIIDISQHSSKGAFSFYFYFISLGAKLFDYFGDMSRTVSWFPFISQLNMIDEVELHQRMYNLEE